MQSVGKRSRRWRPVRAGSKQLSKLAEENKYDPALKEAIAAALHGSSDRRTSRSAGAQAVPAAAGKDNKPLPPLTELASAKGT